MTEINQPYPPADEFKYSSDMYAGSLFIKNAMPILLEEEQHIKKLAHKSTRNNTDRITIYAYTYQKVKNNLSFIGRKIDKNEIIDMLKKRKIPIEEIEEIYNEYKDKIKTLESYEFFLKDASPLLSILKDEKYIGNVSFMDKYKKIYKEYNKFIYQLSHELIHPRETEE